MRLLGTVEEAGVAGGQRHSAVMEGEAERGLHHMGSHQTRRDQMGALGRSHSWQTEGKASGRQSVSSERRSQAAVGIFPSCF